MGTPNAVRARHTFAPCRFWEEACPQFKKKSPPTPTRSSLPEMRVLVIHRNFPGPFGHLAKTWAVRPGWDVRALARETAPGLRGFEPLVRYRPARRGHANQHPYLRRMEDATLHGQAAAQAMLDLKRSGFVPDTIVAHPGWGETLFAKDIYPDARLIHLCEWYHCAEGAELGFDPEFPVDLDERNRIRTWNALHALNLTHCDAAVTPTRWQRSRHPALFRPKITVQHEGIETDLLGPDPMASVTTPSGIRLTAGAPVVTYVARNLEPCRGFHVFMRALERIQRAHPGCHALIVGGDETSGEQWPKKAPTWRQQLLDEVDVDPLRTHFLGRLPCEQYVPVLQVSAAHIHLAYPVALSRSLLEAMACGAFVIGSDTAPVREVIRDGVNGRLVDFFDSREIERQVSEALDQPTLYDSHRGRAWMDGQSFSPTAGLAGYDRLLRPDPLPVVDFDLTIEDLR